MGMQDRRAGRDTNSPAYQAGFEAGAKVALPAADLLVTAAYSPEIVSGREGFYQGLLSRPGMQGEGLFSPSRMLTPVDATRDLEFAVIALGTGREMPGLQKPIFSYQTDSILGRGIPYHLVDAEVDSSRLLVLSEAYRQAFIASVSTANEGRGIDFVSSLGIPGDNDGYVRFLQRYQNLEKPNLPTQDLKFRNSSFHEKSFNEGLRDEGYEYDSSLFLVNSAARQVRAALGTEKLVHSGVTPEWLEAVRALQRAGFAQESRSSWSTSFPTRWSGTDKRGIEEITSYNKYKKNYRHL